MAVGQTATCGRGAPASDKIRNKYNTLTPGEIKKLTKTLFQGSTTTQNSTQQQQHASSTANQSQANLYGTLRHTPMRTASVLHKPRAPPIIVTDLDTTIDQLERSNAFNAPTRSLNTSPNTTITNDNSSQHALARSASIRSSTMGRGATGVGSYDSRRHTVNYGRLPATMDSRTSLHSATSSTTNTANQRRSVIYDLKQIHNQHQASLNESISNLSFKSSLDTTDGGYGGTAAANYDPHRLQTVSVDLGSHQHYNHNNARPGANKSRPHYDSMLRGQTIARIKYNTLTSASSKMFSDESYSSTQSNVSRASTLRPSSATPTKFGSGSQEHTLSSDINNSRSSPKPPRSASKASLSSSTYKVFQSPLANIKRLFRNMPRPFSTTATINQHEHELESKMAAHFETSSINFTSGGSQHHCQDQSLGDLSISDSISQISLNKSQSPPVCPPPPGELKSMCYMESAINYSNYDEFTRTRNERMAQRQQALKDGLNAASQQQQQQQQRQQQLATNYDHGAHSNDSDAWQLTSLPVYYERNLTTVFEEKQQASCELTSEKVQSLQDSSSANGEQQQQQQQQQHLIRPPTQFDDSGDMTLTNEALDKMANLRKSSTEGSMLSLNSFTSTGSAQQQQQRQPVLTPAKPYRFSFAQPLQPPHESPDCVIDDVSFHKNLGLPPRMPAIGSNSNNNNHSTTDQPLSINTSETTTATTTPAPGSVGRRDNSSSGNSSNCSSQLNGINNCDRPTSSDASDKSSYNSNEDSNSLNASATHAALSVASAGGYGNLNGLADNEADVTLLSETSTLQGGSDASGIGYYANKCSELERTVATLKNKLVNKEKELTDLQLNQLNNDYAIERLKKRLGQLERENAQLRATVANKS